MTKYITMTKREQKHQAFEEFLDDNMEELVRHMPKGLTSSEIHVYQMKSFLTWKKGFKKHKEIPLLGESLNRF